MIVLTLDSEGLFQMYIVQEISNVKFVNLFVLSKANVRTCSLDHQ